MFSVFGGDWVICCMLVSPVPEAGFTGDPAVLTSLRVQTEASQKF